MSAAVLHLPGVRPRRGIDAGQLMPFQDALRAGLLPYSTEAAARQAIRRGLLPGVSRQRRWLGGYELLLDPFYLDPWLKQRGRITIAEYRCATRAQLWDWERAGRFSFSRKVSRSRSAIKASPTGKN